MSATQQILLSRNEDSGGSLPAAPSILCHFDGTDGSTTMTDSSPSARTISVFGNAQIDTAQSKFSGASLLLDGSGDYLTAPNSTDFSFGSGDFTVSAWVRLGALGINQAIAAVWGNTGNQLSWYFGIDTNNDPVFYYSTNGTSGTFIASIHAVTSGVFHHIAVDRVGSALTLYINGALPYTTTHGATFFNATTRPLSIGASEASGSYTNFVNGHVDELLILKGVGLYGGSAFTPPGSPYVYP